MAYPLIWSCAGLAWLERNLNGWAGAWSGLDGGTERWLGDLSLPSSVTM